ncbi:MAG: M23 family metallopeptidase [Spirochaetaceae bacterium]|jgi:murein DD-endopeptidase MepM/ murein hydrolase activator NlpD|nr:M23 family metallopeptidase [Spirochaetaceae bacterium]
MIRFDSVDKIIMKDIIASQRVHRRSSQSLLSSAARYQAPGENSLIQDQRSRPMRRKKFQFFKNQPAYPVFQYQPPAKETGVRKTHLSVLAAGFTRLALTLSKKFFPLLGFSLLGALVVAGTISYIPDPEPPEDTLARDVMAGSSGLGFAGISSPVVEEWDEIPLDLTETFAWQDYLVRPGDSVELIARHFGLSLDAVIASNGLRNVRRELRAGQKIRIPNMDGIPYTVKSGDSYAKIAKSLEVPVTAILDANDIQSDDIRAGTVLFIPGAKMDKNELRQALGELFIFPVVGRQSSPFGWRIDPFSRTRGFHSGLDIASRTGTPVKASADGRVSATGTNAVYGNFIILTHAGDYQTMYAHLSRILVQKGVYVNQGTVIGRVGSTGRSTGPHLHFSVYKNKRAINPLEVLTK